MTFPWDRRLATIEAQEVAAKDQKAHQVARADAQAVTKQIADWYARQGQSPTSPVIPGGWSMDGLRRVAEALASTAPASGGGTSARPAIFSNGET